MDLEALKELGVELNEEQAKALTDQFNQQVSAINSKKEAVLSEKKRVEQQLREQKEALEQAEIEKAKAAGSIQEVEERLKTQYESKLGESTSQLDELKKTILSKEKQAVKAQLMALATDDSSEAFSVLLDSLLSADYSEGNSIVTMRGLDGGAVGTKLDSMKEYISTSAQFAPLIRAKVGTGGGAKGSGSGGGAVTKSNLTGRDALIAKAKQYREESIK